VKQAGLKRRRAVARGPSSVLKELVQLSQAVGVDPDQVQGGGGNTSVKTGDGRSLYIKASGTALGDVTSDRGWAELDLLATRALVEDEELRSLAAEERERSVLRRLLGCVKRPSGAQPSVDSCLHALLGRAVIHTHPIGLNALLCSRDSRERFGRIVRDVGGAPLYLPYSDPGWLLSTRLLAALTAYRAEHGGDPSVVLLENHGLLVSAESAKKCVELVRKVTEIGTRWGGGRRVNPVAWPWVIPPAPVAARKGGAASRVTGRAAAASNGRVEIPELAEIRGGLLRAGCAPGVVRRDDSSLAVAFARDNVATAQARRGALTPDQVSYCGARPLIVRSGAREKTGERLQKAAGQYRERYGMDPRVVILAGQGVYYSAPDLRRVRIVNEVYRGAIHAMRKSSRAGGPRFLNSRQVGFVEGWELHQPRPAAARSLEGRIAAVTGAASGLGKGIAAGLIAKGATVCGLDVNAGMLADVSGEYPAGRFLPVAVDVTDEASVEAGFRTIEQSGGGLDFLVNAAGIAPSYPLVDFPLAAWRKTLEINLTGYFLCAREAARLLLRQGSGGAMVNLTSKSGLEASKENSAYNATKAGEIHLMRGWALELGRADIRINCVAPGNVFKGSKIWNADYIRACAKKKGIRPEEVIPYYTSLAPLGKEILPQDVAGAVAFLLSDEASNISGQTLVVDGGQVPVR
jgi:NAD(P)-dependent dehydrogenase (short-subunit alcohol dehydrogenase family)/rhamnose utilization protein RhaD (predicted bifunctional aldolase and dehydrogenase)